MWLIFPSEASLESRLSLCSQHFLSFSQSIPQVLQQLPGAWGRLTCEGRWQMQCSVAHGGPRWERQLGISCRAKWEGKHFRELWNVYAKLKGRTEGDGSVNGVVLYITIFCGIRLTKYSVNMKKWQSALPNSFMSLCVSFSGVFVCYGSYHYGIYKYMLYSMCFCCQKSIHFTDVSPLLSRMLYEETAHSDDTVRGTLVKF